MSSADRIEQLIATRRCTRTEWRALRRHERRKARGLPTLDFALALALVVGRAQFCLRLWWRRLTPEQRAALRMLAEHGRKHA